MHMPTDTEFKPVGFLYIGDPHISSRNIGRRKDDYMRSGLAKLDACAALCWEKKLLPVILGDLLHRNDDSKPTMLNKLVRTLKRFPVAPLVLEGNHDKEKTELSDEDVLTLLVETDVVELVGEGAFREFLFEGAGAPVRLWGCPYGATIPRHLPEFNGATVMLTHHDMAFSSSYPGALPLIEIHNCAMVVNGHMHDTKPLQKMGQTVWHNPGNIESLSVDLAHHVPKAWEWRPDMATTELCGHLLPHGTDLFDIAGLEVAAADAGTAVAGLPTQESSFARLLASQSSTEAAKTTDGTVLVEDLGTVLSAQNASDPVRRLMLALAGKVSMAPAGAPPEPAAA